jgi:CMP/dCMP kinase
MFYAKKIAIDGGAGSGKSTIGTKLADTLGYLFVDAGMLYRAITSEILNAARFCGLDIQDESAVADRLGKMGAGVLVLDDKKLSIHVNRRIINENLHTEPINRAVPVVAAYPAVRSAVRQLQAELAQHDGLVFAGRDIGTVVMPHADLKLFLQVSLEERVNRRYKSFLESDPTITRDQIMQDMLRRDEMDSSRKESPLRPAYDAILIDTDHLGIAEVLDLVLNHARRVVA